MPTIWLIGDSTVDSGQEPFRGWGYAMPEYAAEGVTVRNCARSGRSALSFREEGLFQPVQEGMQPGDLLLIQFGHNDEQDLPELHTDPLTTFPELLSWYCDEAIARGALPVLVTPVSRRYYISGIGMLLYTHGEYPAAVRKLAADRALPLVNLKAKSRAKYNGVGEEATGELFERDHKGENPNFPDGHNDLTHLNARGAMQIAALVAEDLRADPRTAAFVR